MGGEVVTCCQMELIEAKSAFWLMIWGPEEGAVRSGSSSDMRSPPWAARSLHAGEWWWQTPRRRGEGSEIRPCCPCERKLGKLRIATMWDAKDLPGGGPSIDVISGLVQCGVWYEWPFVADMNIVVHYV